MSTKAYLHALKRISYNLKSDLETYCIHFAKLGGIKSIMILIEQCLLPNNLPDLISAACNCLVSLFAYNSGLEAVKKKPKRYFEMFLALADLNE